MTPHHDGMDQENTVLAPNTPKATPQNHGDAATFPARRCMALVKGSGQHFTEEIHELLRRRLRVASSIALFGIGYFLALTLYNRFMGVGGIFEGDDFDVALHFAVVALLMFLCTLFWTSYTLSHRTLRVLELVMFASMTVFFADLQFRVFYPAKFAEWAKDGLAGNVVALGNTANNLRWFFLIVLYGMFIPNPWKRCAIVVGCMASIPIVLTLAVCPQCTIMGPVLGGLLFNTIVAMAISSAMAIFGSYRISELHQQAYQARKLGQYQLHRKLGSGGMGEVYLGEHILLKRTCAIKLIRPEQAGDPKTLSRFEREVQSMATLTHWNTVEVFDYGRTDDGTFYYVMEYLPGLSLQELVDLHGPLPAARAIHFLRQICAALKEAHAVGLIHRDIKPSNVIACQRGGVQDVAKLLDFGLVQDIGAFSAGSEKLTVIGAILGSPNFISPEQAAGRGTLDGRTDIYSLGALAYFLVTGQTPFIRETAMELIAAHMKDEPVAPRQLRPEIPQDLEEVILMCLRKSPEDRSNDAESLDLALAACDAAGEWDAGRAKNWWQQSAKRETPIPV